MQSSLVLTVLGPDRAGLVKSIAEAVTAHHGNWQESRMVHLAGQFAGLAHVSLPQEHVADLKQALQALQNDGLQILVTHSEATSPAQHHPADTRTAGPRSPRHHPRHYPPTCRFERQYRRAGKRTTRRAHVQRIAVLRPPQTGFAGWRDGG